jgi:hypothetical protein
MGSGSGHGAMIPLRQSKFAPFALLAELPIYAYTVSVESMRETKKESKWSKEKPTLGIPNSAKYLLFATNFPVPMQQNVNLTPLYGLLQGNAREITKKSWQIVKNSNIHVT